MKKLEELRREKGVLVAAHRGTAGGNIPCNTIAAFDIALRYGADILEMDLFKSVDDELFIFHTGQEPSQLDRHIQVETMTADEIRKLRLVNGDFNETFLGLNTFDEILEHYKGKCILNLDRCIHILDHVVKRVENHHMQNQILLKSDPSEKSLKMVEAYAPSYDYMPIFKEEDHASQRIAQMNINYIGAELVFKSEDSPIASDSYIEKMKKEGKILWANGLVYASKVLLAAGHNDDVSMTESPDKGWGWLVEKGFDIIQTDWTRDCAEYLRAKQ